MFEKENPLPGAELHLGICYGNHFTRPREHHPDMRCAVVGSFVVVLVIGVLRHEPFEEFFQVAARRRCSVFHDDDTAARVLNEDRHGPRGDAAPVDNLPDLVGHFVSSLAFGPNFELLAANAHGRCSHASDYEGQAQSATSFRFAPTRERWIVLPRCKKISSGFFSTNRRSIAGSMSWPQKFLRIIATGNSPSSLS